MSDQLPEPRLRKVYRLEATLAEPLDLGGVVQGHRRIAPLSGGTFAGPEISGKLLGRKRVHLPHVAQIETSVPFSTGSTRPSSSASAGASPAA